MDSTTLLISIIVVVVIVFVFLNSYVGIKSYASLVASMMITSLVVNMLSIDNPHQGLVVAAFVGMSLVLVFLFVCTKIGNDRYDRPKAAPGTTSGATSGAAGGESSGAGVQTAVG